MQTTSRVHEAYLRMVNLDAMDVQGRAHFLAIAAKAIRRVLVDWARREKRQKRARGAVHITVDDNVPVDGEKTLDLLALDEALERLSQEDQRSSTVVELKFFGGLQVDEIASVLNVGSRTVDGDWKFARTWLYRELTRE